MTDEQEIYGAYYNVFYIFLWAVTKKKSFQGLIVPARRFSIKICHSNFNLDYHCLILKGNGLKYGTWNIYTHTYIHIYIYVYIYIYVCIYRPLVLTGIFFTYWFWLSALTLIIGLDWWKCRQSWFKHCQKFFST